MKGLAGKSVRADVVAGIVAGIVGLFVIVVIWVSLVFPAPIVSGGGGILRAQRAEGHYCGVCRATRVRPVAGPPKSRTVRGGWRGNVPLRSGTHDGDQ